MSKKKTGRRPRGHPANVARRQGRDSRRSGPEAAGPARIARRIVGETSELTDALDAELWGSSLLGALWNQRYELSLEQLGSDCAVVFGLPLIEAMRRIGGPGARTALSVIAAVDDGDLGIRARELAAEVPESPGAASPDWLADLGQVAIRAAAVMRDNAFDDASTVFIEARHPGGEVHAVGVEIDHNLGDMATDILLADSIDRVEEILRERPAPDGVVTLERIVPGIAAGRIHAAIELTDMTLDPVVSDDYPDLRALALKRADETPGLVVATERPEMRTEERDRLLDEFLDSPEGGGFAPDSEEAYAISLAIGFCANYVDGRPLRWSPSVVELFMADWVPRKVLGDAGLYASLPQALDAWVRFAGRRSDQPQWAVAATREAITEWRETMVERSEDPDAGGPTKQFLSAAMKAGIDLQDTDALDTFVAGWNARSEVG
jgi:hypothetical protein